MSYFDIEVYEDEELWNGYDEIENELESWCDIVPDIFPENSPTEQELNDMYYYFNTYDDPIRMCNVAVNDERFER